MDGDSSMDRSNSQSIPLQVSGRHSIPKLRKLFSEVDTDLDGFISYCELWSFLRNDDHGLSRQCLRKIHEKADRNDDGQLDFEEFYDLVTAADTRRLFEHHLNRYIRLVIPCKKQPRSLQRRAAAGDATDGLYEDEYSCSPPAVGMITISVFIIILFLVDAIAGSTTANGAIAHSLLFDPQRRIQIWRFITYMFVHVGWFHLIINLLIQILLGTPLEMVHRWWRVLLIYSAGVLAGSLGTSICDPTVRLAGASGGVYSLITAHIATIVLNWREMSYPLIQLLVFLMITVCDVGMAIYNRYVLEKDEHIGYAAHFYGALAGLLVGIALLRNLEITPKERILERIALVVYIILMLVAIIWNISYSSYFPPQLV